MNLLRWVRARTVRRPSDLISPHRRQLCRCGVLAADFDRYLDHERVPIQGASMGSQLASALRARTLASVIRPRTHFLESRKLQSDRGVEVGRGVDSVIDFDAATGSHRYWAESREWDMSLASITTSSSATATSTIRA